MFSSFRTLLQQAYRCLFSFRMKTQKTRLFFCFIIGCGLGGYAFGLVNAGKLRVQSLDQGLARVAQILHAFGQTNNDVDGDGIKDNIDNCLTDQNPLQLDDDNDGFGNNCDADFDNDSIVSFKDVFLLAKFFINGNSMIEMPKEKELDLQRRISHFHGADLDSNGALEISDLISALMRLGRKPGPSVWDLDRDGQADLSFWLSEG